MSEVAPLPDGAPPPEVAVPLDATSTLDAPPSDTSHRSDAAPQPDTSSLPNVTSPPTAPPTADRGSRRWMHLLLVAFVLVASGWLRLRQLDGFIASDEIRWVCRSINFQSAIEAGDWAGTFQVGHPGVVTMWLGSLALPRDQVGRWRELARDTKGCTDLTKLDDVGQEGLLQTLAPLLFRARRGVALGSILILAVLLILLRRGVGLGLAPALAAVAMLGFDPFLLGHSRVLHLDAMVAGLSLLAVVALVPALDPERRGHWWVPLGAGALAGLAMLAKVPALVLGPFALLCYGWRAWRSGEPRRWLGRWCWWLAGAAVVVVALWPAMWVHPVQTVVDVLTKAETEGGVAHEAGNFFMGKLVEDPGPLFYPVAAIFRMTPWALAAFLLALVAIQPGALLRQLRSVRPRGQRLADLLGADRMVHSLLVVLLTWALVFAVCMSIGAKKFDRYLLPAQVALDAAGAIGAVTFLASRRRRPVTHPALVYTLLLAGLQYVEVVGAWPYPISYFNPILGGGFTAQHVLLMGWGEGYDLAARYLNGLPGAKDLEVSARGVANFAPLFLGRTRSAEGFRPGTTDYVVVYKSQVQRRQNPEILAAYHDKPDARPAFVGSVRGVPYVWVYPNATVAPLSQLLDGLTQPGDVLVAGGESVLARHYDGPLALVRYWGHWQAAEMRESLAKDFPPGWRRAWVVRYPGFDPEVAETLLGSVAKRGVSRDLGDGVARVTEFTR